MASAFFHDDGGHVVPSTRLNIERAFLHLLNINQPTASQHVVQQAPTAAAAAAAATRKYRVQLLEEEEEAKGGPLTDLEVDDAWMSNFFFCSKSTTYLAHQLHENDHGLWTSLWMLAAEDMCSMHAARSNLDLHKGCRETKHRKG